jgi:hypothetical protein
MAANGRTGDVASLATSAYSLLAGICIELWNLDREETEKLLGHARTSVAYASSTCEGRLLRWRYDDNDETAASGRTGETQ